MRREAPAGLQSGGSTGCTFRIEIRPHSLSATTVASRTTLVYPTHCTACRPAQRTTLAPFAKDRSNNADIPSESTLCLRHPGTMQPDSSQRQLYMTMGEDQTVTSNLLRRGDVTVTTSPLESTLLDRFGHHFTPRTRPSIRNNHAYS